MVNIYNLSLIIYMVDSNTNETLSHGFVSYTIQPKSSLQIADYIQNKASIVFDYNAPIITNTTMSVVMNTTTNNDTAICEGQSLTLTAQGASNYLWNNSQTGSNITVSPSTTTNYIVTGSVQGITQNDTVNVTVKPLPNASFTENVNNNSVSVTANNGNDLYSWNFGDGTTSTEQNPTHQYTGNGQYTITLNTSLDGCENTSTKQINITITAIKNNISFVEDAKVFVNNNQQIELNLLSNKYADFNISLYDISGKILNTRNYNKVNSINQKIDVATLSKGIYFMNIQSGKELMSYKIVLN
ncbi:MAG: PKD domain-containing protein [Chitinophagales bacterium]